MSSISVPIMIGPVALYLEIYLCKKSMRLVLLKLLYSEDLTISVCVELKLRTPKNCICVPIKIAPARYIEHFSIYICSEICENSDDEHAPEDVVFKVLVH